MKRKKPAENKAQISSPNQPQGIKGGSISYWMTLYWALRRNSVFLFFRDMRQHALKHLGGFFSVIKPKRKFSQVLW